MYSATAIQIYGDAKSYSLIRKKSALYLEASSRKNEFYKNVIESKGYKFQEYLEMKKNNGWGDLPDIYLFAEMYKRRFMVYGHCGNLNATTGD